MYDSGGDWVWFHYRGVGLTVVIEFSLTTVESALCITPMVIEFNFTTVEVGFMYNSGGDWVWSHYRGVGLTYNGKQGDNSGSD